jgi:DNA-binding response OmpR family regulator
MNIALVDDKQYGMEQIQNALPSDFSGKTVWFSSAQKFLLQSKIFDIVFLDYYLDEDGITGDTVLQKIRSKAKIIIGFSSIASGNVKLLRAGADYTVEKSHMPKNEILENILLEVIYN